MAKKLNTAAAAERFSKLSEAVEKEQKAVEKTEIIPIDSIVMNQDNIFSNNDTDESISELAQNIYENGLLHNIVVAEIEPNKYLLISGERRTKAVKSLGQDKIRATIRKNLSEFEILKMLFFANSETREYTTEEKINIIENFQKKIDQYENRFDKDAIKKFREYVSQAFNINERQASKLITITTELTEPLKQYLYSDLIDINTAASLAQLPEKYQSYAENIINAALQNQNCSDSKKYAVEQVSTFSKQVKNIISKTNNNLAKDKTSRTYHNERLAKSLDELSEIETTLLNDDSTPEKKAECTERKNETEQLIKKYHTVLDQLNKRIDDELNKQHNAVEDVYLKFKLTDIIEEKEENNENTQDKEIEKEIRSAENAIKKLIRLKPSNELNTIQELLKKYKNSAI